MAWQLESVSWRSLRHNETRFPGTCRHRAAAIEQRLRILPEAADGALEVRTTGNQGSGVLSSMVQANGLIVLPHSQGDVAVGDEVEVMMFDGAI